MGKSKNTRDWFNGKLYTPFVSLISFAVSFSSVKTDFCTFFESQSTFMLDNSLHTIATPVSPAVHNISLILSVLQYHGLQYKLVILQCIAMPATMYFLHQKRGLWKAKGWLQNYASRYKLK